MKEKLHLSRYDKKIFGVCGGIAESTGWDPSLVRLAWVISLFILHWIPLAVYALCALCFSKERA